jgi:hypothetical protein
MSYTVFISHASGGMGWVAWALGKDADHLGADYFLDEVSISSGSSVRKTIRDNLWTANELWIVLTPPGQSSFTPPGQSSFTPSIQSSPWVWMEFGAAWLRDIPIVPILYHISPEDVWHADEIPSPVKDLKMIVRKDTPTVEYQRFLAEFKTRVDRASRHSFLSRLARLFRRPPPTPPIRRSRV